MSAQLPRISVVIPLYNKAQYVQRAVESALAQGDAILEVIVVDDGSTDDSAAQVEALNHVKIRLVKKPNGGVSSARNRGINDARGDFVAFLDADDFYMPGFAAEILYLIEHFPDAGVYATGFNSRGSDGRMHANYLPRSIDANKAQVIRQPFKAWSRVVFFHIGSVCVRRDIFFQRNIFFPLGENIGEDTDVIFRLIETGEIAFSPKPLMTYSLEVKNSLYSNKPDYVLPCYTRLAERARSSGYPHRLRAGAYRVVSVSYLNATRILLGKGRRAAAARLLFSARLSPHPSYWLRTLIRLCLPNGLLKIRWLKWL